MDKEEKQKTIRQPYKKKKDNKINIVDKKKNNPIINEISKDIKKILKIKL